MSALKWLVIVVALGCSGDPDEVDAIPDAGQNARPCPEHRPDGGVVNLTRRGCPLTIEYSIK